MFGKTSQFFYGKKTLVRYRMLFCSVCGAIFIVKERWQIRPLKKHERIKEFLFLVFSLFVWVLWFIFDWQGFIN
jgi:hypothetical protein